MINIEYKFRRKYISFQNIRQRLCSWIMKRNLWRLQIYVLKYHSIIQISTFKKIWWYVTFCGHRCIPEILIFCVIQIIKTLRKSVWSNETILNLSNFWEPWLFSLKFCHRFVFTIESTFSQKWFDFIQLGEHTNFSWSYWYVLIQQIFYKMDWKVSNQDNARC